MFKKAKAVLIAAALACGIPAANAAVSYATDAGVAHTTDALTGSATYGDMMNGMSVTAIFSDGSTETKVWSVFGSGYYGVFGVGFRLLEGGDTFTSQWTLMGLNPTSGLTGIVIDAAPGNTVFDINNGGPGGSIAEGQSSGVGSPGSDKGSTFTLMDSVSVSFDIVATYRNIVSIGANPAVGDLWTTLDLRFEGGELSNNQSLKFKTDTDKAASAGDIIAIPEPASLALLALGILGIGASMRRRIA